MTRIGSNLGGVDLSAQSSLNRAIGSLQESSTRLATLSRINRGSDDPAGLIALEQLRAELTSLEAADSNAARAASTIHVADSALAQVGDLLNTIQGKIVESASQGTLSPEQLAANQTEIDAALEAIDRIGGTTAIGGRKLLDGSAESLTLVLSSDPASTSTLSLPNVSTTTLGSTANVLASLRSGGANSLASGNYAAAAEAVSAARNQVLSARAQAGAFEKFTIDSAHAVLAGAQENLSAAIRQIGDADVALESSHLIRAKILTQSAVLALRIVNHRRELVLGLLSG
jgi:flagellin